MLLWEDGSNNNFLHLAASIDHIQFIRRIISTQDGNEVQQALFKKNADGLIPYYMATTEPTLRLLAWSESQLGCYPLVAPPRVVVFYSDTDRPGSDTEKESFIRMLPRFGIEPQVVLNPTEKDVYDIIRENQTGELSALVVVIMTHGDRGTVTVKNGNMPIDSILMQMNPTRLSGIPKVRCKTV